MNNLFKLSFNIIRRNLHTSAPLRHKEGKFRLDTWKEKIGNREIVGYGVNGDPNYFDDPAFPFPSIRFKENRSSLQVLRIKEQGDWRKLSKDEKKALYRASFCHTFAEFKASTTDWMLHLGFTFMLISISIWYYIFIKLFAYDDLPDTFTDLDRRAHQLRRMIDAEINPITGLSSKWDYEKEEWKSNPGKWYRQIDVWNLWYPIPKVMDVEEIEFEECKDFSHDEIILDEDEKDVCTCEVADDLSDICPSEPTIQEPTTYATGDDPATVSKFASVYTCIEGEEPKNDEKENDEKEDDE